MARRPPAFVRNLAAARRLNIAHGLYPREAFGQTALDNLVKYLRGAVRVDQGRTYAGGLTKFEPREMERILVPGPELLARGDFKGAYRGSAPATTIGTPNERTSWATQV